MIDKLFSLIRKFTINSNLKKIYNYGKDWEINYIKSFQEENSASTNAVSENLRYVVFDTETTGMDPKKDSLLSIGALGIQGNSIIIKDYFYELIKTERSSGKDIIVHGIFPSESRDGKSEEEVIQNFIKFIHNSVIIAHHIDFDLDFLNNSISKYSSLKIYNRAIDTAKLAERIEEKIGTTNYIQDRTRLRLDSLCKKYDIPQFTRHHALSDSLVTAILFLKLQSKWMRMGRERLNDILIK